jgi:hypothetical protein
MNRGGRPRSTRKPMRQGGNNNKKTTVPKILRSLVEPKYFDTLSTANSIGSGGTIFPLTGIPQGDSQSSRVGDFINPLSMIFNFTLYTVNSDIVTTIRLIWFKWKPSTATTTITVASILEAPASSNVLSHFNFQLQQQFTVLHERQFQASGITTAPTVSSNFGATGMPIPIGSSDLEFSLGSVNGTNQFFLLAISDSALTPFPVLSFSNRLYYEDTIKKNLRKVVK